MNDITSAAVGVAQHGVRIRPEMSNHSGESLSYTRGSSFFSFFFFFLLEVIQVPPSLSFLHNSRLTFQLMDGYYPARLWERVEPLRLISVVQDPRSLPGGIIRDDQKVSYTNPILLKDPILDENSTEQYARPLSRAEAAAAAAAHAPVWYSRHDIKRRLGSFPTSYERIVCVSILTLGMLSLLQMAS